VINLKQTYIKQGLTFGRCSILQIFSWNGIVFSSWGIC